VELVNYRLDIVQLSDIVIGDMSTFPSNTELIIGPGTDRKVYPEHKDALLLESDFK